MKRNRGYIDMSPVFIGATLAALVLIMAGVIRESVKEGERWDAFKVDHKCKVVAHISGNLITTFGLSGSGKPVVGTSSTPDKTGWLCDDGITYYR